MKVWQKVYLAVLILVLFTVNLGLFFASGFLYRQNLSQEESQAETECYFLSRNLARDFERMQENRQFRQEVMEKLLSSYKKSYKKKGVRVDLIRKGSYQTGIFREDGDTVAAFASVLPAPFEDYTLIYEKKLKGFDSLWKNIQQAFFCVGIGISLILGIFLYLLLQKLLLPLSLLNSRVMLIAQGRGKYGGEMPGRVRADEIGELWENVDRMGKTIRSQMELLETENEKKQQLLDNMAHELRTPLTSIYGYAEYLTRAKAGEEERYQALSYIMKESKRLSGMGETMLSMRLFQREEPLAERVDMEQVFAHVKQILAGKMKEKQIILKEDYKVSEAWGREELFVNVFRNLLENALRASETQGEIFIGSGETDGYGLFTVEDKGVGMTQEELSHIMEPFYRADKSRSRKEGGAGLGLSVAKLIVEKLGGKISFSSEKGKGTKVFVFLQLPDKSVKRGT